MEVSHNGRTDTQPQVLVMDQAHHLQENETGYRLQAHQAAHKDPQAHQGPNGAVTEPHTMAQLVALELMVLWASPPWGPHTEGTLEDQDLWVHKDR